MSIEQIKKILLILNDGQFHSGADIGTMLGITRSAVWKITQQLPLYRIDLESVVGKGYRLLEPIDFLSAEKIHAQLSPQTVSRIKCLEIFDTLTSTQAYLLSRIYETSRQPRLCVSEHKTLLKKHRSDHPTSAFGQQIDYSLLWVQEPDPHVDQAELPKVLSVSIAKVLEQLGLSELALQSPHHIVHQHQLIAFFSVTERQHPQHGQILIIQVEVTQRLKQRNLFISKLTNQLLYALDLFRLHQSHLFIEDWHRLNLPQDQLHFND